VRSRELAQLVGALSFTGSAALGFDRILLVESPTDGLALQQFLRLKGKDHRVLTLPLGGSTLINGTSTTEMQLTDLKRITPRIFSAGRQRTLKCDGGSSS
jgi:hypothetical protein